MSSLDTSFPLDNARLPKLLVDEETMNDWASAAKAEVANVIQNLDSWYFRADELKGSFKLTYEKESLVGFTRTNPQVADKNDFLCQGTLQLSLDDVAFGLHNETTFEFRSAQVQLYPDSFLDAAVLRMTERPTSEDPFRFTGVKWEAHGSAGSGIATARDYLYFERLSRIRDALGRDVVVQYVESLELPAHQLQDHGIRLARAGTFAINTFRPDIVHGGVLYQSAGSVGVSKNVPSWAGAAKGLPHSFRSVLKLSELADARTIFSLGMLKKLPKQPRRPEASERKTCIVCDKKFHVLTRSRHKCRSCGRCACRSCIVALKFFNQASVHSSRDHRPVLSEQFCIKCVMNSREQRRSDLSTFAKMSESIAAQSALLLKLQSSMSFAGAPMSTAAEADAMGSSECSSISSDTRSASDRFELLS